MEIHSKEKAIARRPRLFGKRLYHHIYAWGNNRQAIFITDEHYAKYLDFLEKFSRDYRVDIIAYALMQTHVHLFVYDILGKVSQFMNSLHGEYAQYFNSAMGRVGHLFGERFNNKVVQANVYGLWLSRYIHRQALEAGLVIDPRAYPWSSYRAYVGEVPQGFVRPSVILEQFGVGKEGIARYDSFVNSSERGPLDWDGRSATVVGDEGFVKEVLDMEITEQQQDSNDVEIRKLVNVRFGGRHDLISSAHGMSEKRLRRKIIRYLIKECGYRPSKIAQLFHISRSAVQRALNAEM